VTESSTFQSGALLFELPSQPKEGVLPESLKRRVRIAGPRMLITWKVRPRLLNLLPPALLVAGGLLLLREKNVVDWLWECLGCPLPTMWEDLLAHSVGAVLVAWGALLLLQRGISKALGT
jgi:hypothetical protein